MKKRLPAIIIALLLLSLLAWALNPRPLDVETARVQIGRFERSVEDDGWTRVRDRYVISAPLSGNLARVKLREGDIVKSGDTVALIRPAAPPLLDVRANLEQRERVATLEAQARAAQISIDRARVALQQARTDFGRNETLYERHFIAGAQADAARLAMQLREKELMTAEKTAHAAAHALNEARVALRDASGPRTRDGVTWPVRSPVSGRVLRIAQQSESVVQTGAPLLEVGNPLQLEVLADPLTEDAAQVHSGMTAWLSNWGGPGELKARVRLVEPSAFTKVSALGVEEQRVNVVLDIISPPEQWRALGDRFRVDVRIPVQLVEQARMVPVGALFPSGASSALFVAREGRAVLQEVEVIARNGRQAWIKTELAPGTEVVAYPPATLKDGDRVRQMRKQ